MALTSSPEQPQPLRTIVAATKAWVERLGGVWVEGQLIEIQRRSGVTQFMTLRDKVADFSVRLSASAAVLDAAGPLAEGTVVTAHLRPTVWSKTGTLTFDCSDLRPSGEGRLLAQLEQTKRRLQAEGLFDPSRKKPLPFLPRRIGLVTAANSAAERDVVENIGRRWPAARLEIRHALMQGPSSAGQVADAIAALDRLPEVDVIVVARGGGSLEDLLPFSDEGLARAVFACRTPVVSAIGHETDTPILDLVADLRASTPTDAAKRVVPDAAEEAQRLAQALGRIRRAITGRLDAEGRRLRDLRSRPVLRDPSAIVGLHVERLDGLRQRLRRAMAHRIERENSQVSSALSRVRAMSPRATLQRGYAILTDTGGGAVTSAADIAVGDPLLAHLADGQLGLAVTDVRTPKEPR